VRLSGKQKANGFLEGFPVRPVKLAGAEPRETGDLYLGQGPGALEILLVRRADKPTTGWLRDLWRRRQGNRAVPLLVVAVYADRAALCGATGEDPPVYTDVDLSVVERVCATALRQPSRHAALRFLYAVLPHIDSELPGIRNEGFLTLHELQYGVPRERAAFEEATQKAHGALAQRGLELLQALGFQPERIDDHTYRLLAQDRRRAVAVLLLPDEPPDAAASRFANLSPVSYALATAEKENVPYVLLLNDTSLRLHPVKDGMGVAQRGRTETFVELNLDLIPEDRAGYLWLLCSAEALAEGGTLEKILDKARDHATHVGTRLRQRIYQDVIPRLAMAVSEARGIRKPTIEDLTQTYEVALTLLFRVLFIAYAEDKDLLPYRTNEAYRRRSLKEKARELWQIRKQGREIGVALPIGMS